jgi:hypothetical protein
MRLSGASERVRRIAIVVAAATGAALVLWRLWPGQPVPQVPGVPPDHPADDASATREGPAADEASATREDPRADEAPRADGRPSG